MPKNATGLAHRFEALARASGIAPGEPLTLGLSGGVDSVALALLAAAGTARDGLELVHVDHGWRADPAARAACEALAERLGRPLHLRTLALDPRAPNAEAVARKARYAVLFERARATGRTTLITAHHADDRIENALLRWRRGGLPNGWSEPDRSQLVRGELGGHIGDRRRSSASIAVGSDLGAPVPVRLVRPLLGTRRSELRELVERSGATWVEDPSNLDRAHARNAVRHDLLPLLARLSGAGHVRESIGRIARAVAELDRLLESELPGLEPVPWAVFTRTPSTWSLGGTAPVDRLCALEPSMAARVLGLLIERHTGQPARERTLADFVEQLVRVGAVPHGARLRATLAGDWQLDGVVDARKDPSGARSRLVLQPPPARLAAPPQPLSIADFTPARTEPFDLDDGRRIASADLAALLAHHGATTLVPNRIRSWRAGDRTPARGARPERAAVRELAERGVPPSERHLALVVEVRDSTRSDRALVIGPVPSLPAAAGATRSARTDTWGSPSAGETERPASDLRR
ncbi:tRNA(Ile)-lysidine synthase [Planctomycetes bacterium Pla163]|uniref:tRNA(Ile)-lysidine synthase n=1 Tax=Rohdeia mirabilis TaxID=2528008 RepID=A0A518CZY4_9BACT|nr:tRNA(Ile)-lysidine synthase [Planctomycetes bacterium Pla163]